MKLFSHNQAKNTFFCVKHLTLAVQRAARNVRVDSTGPSQKCSRCNSPSQKPEKRTIVRLWRFLPLRDSRWNLPGRGCSPLNSRPETPKPEQLFLCSARSSRRNPDSAQLPRGRRSQNPNNSSGLLQRAHPQPESAARNPNILARF